MHVEDNEGVGQLLTSWHGNHHQTGITMTFLIGLAFRNLPNTGEVFGFSLNESDESISGSELWQKRKLGRFENIFLMAKIIL